MVQGTGKFARYREKFEIKKFEIEKGCSWGKFQGTEHFVGNREIFEIVEIERVHCTSFCNCEKDSKSSNWAFRINFKVRKTILLQESSWYFRAKYCTNLAGF